MSQIKHYLITGGTGFIGTQLCKVLLANQQQLTLLTRNKQQATQSLTHALGADVATSINLIESLDNFNEAVDIIINLAGQGIMDKRWTSTIKQQLLDSRIQTTQALVRYAQRCERLPELIISGSAIGYYGIAHGDTALDENAGFDNSFASQLCQQWEKTAAPFIALGIRTCYLRTGIVLGNGGALAKMLPPFRLGLGGLIGSGTQWMSWIHMNDLVSIILYICTHQEITGAVNGTAPQPVQNKVFTKVLGDAIKRPAFIPMPAFLLKLLLGEGAEELLLSGQKVLPSKIQAAGFSFQYPALKAAMADVVG